MSLNLHELGVVEVPEEDDDLFGEAEAEAESRQEEEVEERYEEEPHQDPKAPRGARSLMNICQGIMMRCQARYDDIGYLMYVQHPLFFDTLGVEQLREIEANSPSLRPETDHLWRKFAARMDPANGAHFKDEETKSWRKAYRVFEKVEARRRAASALAARQMYMMEEQNKKARSIKLVNDVVGSKAKGRITSGTWGGPPKTPLGQIRGKTAFERQKRTIPTALTASDRLIRSTSTSSSSASITGSSSSSLTTSMFKPTGTARLPSWSSSDLTSSLPPIPTVHTAGMNVRRFGPDLEALTACGMEIASRHRVYEKPPSPLLRTIQRKESEKKGSERAIGGQASSSWSSSTIGAGQPAAGSRSRLEAGPDAVCANKRDERTMGSEQCSTGGKADSIGKGFQTNGSCSSSSTSSSLPAGPDDRRNRKREREALAEDGESDVELLDDPSPDFALEATSPTEIMPRLSTRNRALSMPEPVTRTRPGSSAKDAIPLIDIDDLPPKSIIPSTGLGPQRSMSGSSTASTSGSNSTPRGGNVGPTKGFGQAWRTADSSLFIPKGKRKKVG